MAHVLLERMLSARGADGRIRVRSGGIAPYARDGMLASLDARLVLREIGIDLGETTFTSTDLKRHPELIAQADLILTMTAAQRDKLAEFPEAAGRALLTLREFAGEPGDIEDPVLQGEAAFRACRDEIQRALEVGLARLLAGGGER